MMLILWARKYILLRKTLQLLLFASKETGLELNADKFTYTVKSLDQYAGRSQYL